MVTTPPPRSRLPCPQQKPSVDHEMCRTVQTIGACTEGYKAISRLCKFRIGLYACWKVYVPGCKELCVIRGSEDGGGGEVGGVTGKTALLRGDRFDLRPSVGRFPLPKLYESWRELERIRVRQAGQADGLLAGSNPERKDRRKTASQTRFQTARSALEHKLGPSAKIRTARLPGKPAPKFRRRAAKPERVACAGAEAGKGGSGCVTGGDRRGDPGLA